MSTLSAPFPWSDFIWFVTQLIGIVITPIILLVIAIAAGLWLASVTGRLSSHKAKVLRVAIVSAIIILPPTVVMLIAQSSTAIPIAILALAASLCFSITVITTERESFRTQTNW
jgi:hypothetical protein